ncbi:PREDICTED: mitochondrial carnitine/acylcarnitine carrier protein-like isoform X2 [Acropora digitifera]|uniref:mitochondrial carnitine/acylcarnitine carrier protein-like isoform X2 n=1 Tax=Acropora digitifera TaxID=70779 RepID=UPI00077AA1AD|nr:PREDICTED: mitochondrial carnitine/acylcarnitine carrier protein-like isoform X2 [Acropora digitifera]
MGRRLQMADPYGIPTHLQNFNAGMFAGACGAILVVPCDRIKCLLQVQQSLAGEKTFKGPLHCANKLYREGGIRSLYKGTCATLLREVPGMGLYFLSYEWILDKLTLQGQSRENLNPVRVVIAGGTTGMICWFSILPLDVLKSRVQIAPEGTYPKGTRDALRKLVKEERITSLYKGLTPVMIRAFVGNAGLFLGFEVTLMMFNWILPE